jgi:amino acid transporter
MTTSIAREGAASVESGDRGGIADKGLRRGAIGLIGSTVLGIVQTAPAFSIAVTLGFLAAAVGVLSPLLVIAGFIPIYCMTVIEREFVEREPDCGTVFVWVGRTLGPHAGWLASWGLLAATLISLANLVNVTGVYAFQTIGADGAAGSHAATIAVGCAWLAVATYLAVRGLEISSRVQIALLAFGVLVISVFVIVALVKVGAGSAGPQAHNPSWTWFDPFRLHGTGTLSAGLLLTIYLFWGWDGGAAVAEEASGGTTTPKRAILLAALALLGFYVVATVALQAYAGTGAKGIGLGNPDNSGDVLSVVSRAAVGDWFGTLMNLAVLTSAAACLTAAIVPTARSVLSMGAYRALPSVFARVDERTGSPVAATLAVGTAIASVLIVLTLISNNVLSDAILALVLLIAFYYSVLGVAAIWAFRKRASRSAGELVRLALVPALGTLVLAWAFERNARATWAKDYGYTILLGHGGVFVIGIGTLMIGALLMLLWNAVAPAFFRRETFAPGYIAEHRPDLLERLRL